MTERSIVGDLINFRGLVYSPMNEQGGVFLFGKVAGDLNMYVEEIGTGFPDCVGRRFTGKGWEQVRIEFEFRSMEFKNHGHDTTKCDLIVCWENNWPDCPLEVIELRDEIRGLPNEPPERPGAKPKEHVLPEVMSRQKVHAKTRALFQKLDSQIRSLDDRVFPRVRKYGLSYFSPERAFVAIWLRSNALFIEFFTGGQAEPDVGVFAASPLWGHVKVTDEKSRDRAFELIQSALGRIRQAVNDNRPTAYTTPLETVEAEAEEEEVVGEESAPSSETADQP